ncbi:alpha/beta hydrolase [Actinoplanes sp. NPDC023714]|uniref:alpha/beta fold hydrolase n=1 Tax=Actinoplanes sp. NPDC023714 TaxID=3154322 RepID=UPI0033DCF5E4
MSSPWSTVGAVAVNGVRLGYREAGPAGAPAVLLLHGTGSHAGTWDRFAARLLPAGFRVIAADLRGHASSARPGDYALAALRDDVLGLLEEFALRDTVVVGHSVGAHAALAAALEAPSLISRLVLEDLAAPPVLGGLAVLGAPPVLGGLAGPLAVAARLFAGRDLGVKAAIFQQLARPDPAWWERLAEVRQPALVLSGGRTSCIPPRRLAAVTARMPDARLATIPVGHRVHSLAPDRFHAEVAAFLAIGAPVPA